MRPRIKKAIQLTFGIMMVSFSLSHATEETKPCGLTCPEASTVDSAKTILDKEQVGPVNETLDAFSQLNSVSAVQCDPEKVVRDELKVEDPPSAVGGRIVMAQMYGSCDVLELPVINNLIQNKISKAITFRKIPEGNKYSRMGVSSSQLSTLRSSHPYLQGFKTSTCFTYEKCKTLKGMPDYNSNVCTKASCDPILDPPFYQYGAKSDGKNSVYQHRNKNGYYYSGIDCSGFVSQALAVQGLRYVPNKDQYDGGGSANFANLGKKDALGNALDCFDEPITVNGVQPGDLMTAPGNHIIMIDTVGEDPYGLNSLFEKAKSQELDQIISDACSKKFGKVSPSPCKIQSILELLSPEAPLDADSRGKQLNLAAETVCSTHVDRDLFQVTIIHSTSGSNRTGVQRQHVKDGLYDPLSTLMETKGIRDCIEKFRSIWSEALPGITLPKSEVVKNYETKATTNGATKLLRHMKDRTGCTGPKSSLKSLHCSSCCDFSANYQNLVKKQEVEGNSE